MMLFPTLGQFASVVSSGRIRLCKQKTRRQARASSLDCMHDGAGEWAAFGIVIVDGIPVNPLDKLTTTSKTPHREPPYT
jgi:hypothetical protein